MARRSTSISVSLFPFLAVLLCAMGALIVLLVILTQQVRENVIAGATVRQMQTARSDTGGRDVSPPAVPRTAAPEVVTIMRPPAPGWATTGKSKRCAAKGLAGSSVPISCGGTEGAGSSRSIRSSG